MRIGFLPQEPQLDPGKTVRETVEQGLSEVLDAKAKLDAVYAAYAEPDADFDMLSAEQAKYEAIISAAGADSDVQMEIAANALRLPPWDAKMARRNDAPDFRLPLLDRRPMLRIGRADVVGAGANQPVVFVLFHHVRGPARHAAHRENWRE